jgi:hypothetical protein
MARACNMHEENKGLHIGVGGQARRIETTMKT